MEPKRLVPPPPPWGSRLRERLESFFSGLCGGVAGLIVGHPFDTVKVRLQTQGTHGIENRYTSMVQCFWNILKTERIWGLYKGVLSPLIGFSAMNSIMFGVYGNVLHHLERGHSKIPQMWNVALAGGIGGFAQLSVVVPMELIRTRMQVQGVGEKGDSFFALHQTSQEHRLYENSLDCAKKLYRSGGIRSLYQGFTITLCRDIPASSLYFVIWELFVQHYTKDKPTRHSLGMLEMMLAGGVTGTVGWFLVYPIDVIKTRIQIDGIGEKSYSGIVDCARKSFKEEGPRVFFKGLTPTLVRAFPANAVIFLVYAKINSFFHKWRN
jgi:solute carrier family 25 carnitine/acylcarnitine transporter 20/29